MTPSGLDICRHIQSRASNLYARRILAAYLDEPSYEKRKVSGRSQFARGLWSQASGISAKKGRSVGKPPKKRSFVVSLGMGRLSMPTLAWIEIRPGDARERP